MLRCIAVDDEPLALDLLVDNISQVPYLQLIEQCSNAFEAINILQQQPIDLIFLDIQMPGLTGLQFIQSMPQKPMIILVTAYEKYALDGFNLDVTDYLVKPVSFERFVKACNKALELFELKNKKEVATENGNDYIFVNVEYKLLKVVLTDIVWIEGLKDYIKIHLKSTNRPVITRMSLKTIEEQLPSGKFIRVHKSYIVSVNYITAVMKNSIFIGELELPVGDLYRDVLHNLTGRSGG
ncbi:MAG TPA: LytTR family DNA-binding domain-containing protein [Panacibacter sp.]|nr:LytTR family DNA-binding domain-containing protein [Panacibacter sp.]HNP45929.1 LytTR family DNA-binding domain-containing protein [Panacibacter sp.]